MPRISIIIATYNRAQLLPRAVESARRAAADAEIVVVDDASTDDTATVCRSLPGIRYVRLERNQRLGGARNVGILASRAELITFLDDDDLRLPGLLDVQADALDSCPAAGLVYGQAILGDQDCAPTGFIYPDPCPQGDVFWELLQRNFIACPAAVFRRACLSRIGLPGDTIPGIEDWDLWLRIAELYPVVAVAEPVAIYRKATPASGQFTSAAAAMVRRITAAHRERWMTLPRAACAPAAKRREVRRAFSRNMANHLVWEAACAVRQRDWRAAEQNLWTACGLHPRGIAHRLTRPSNVRFLYSRIVGKLRSAEARRASSNL